VPDNLFAEHKSIKYHQSSINYINRLEKARAEEVKKKKRGNAHINRSMEMGDTQHNLHIVRNSYKIFIVGYINFYSYLL